MKLFSKVPLLLTLCLALAVGACGDEEDELVKPIEGTITGTVSADGQPLQGVTLEIAGPITTTNTTGVDGTFAFTDVEEGNYVVSVVLAPQDVAFPDPDKNVSVTAQSPDATATFDGTFN